MRKSAAERENMNSEQFDREYDLDRPTVLEQIIQIIKEEDAELLERLRND